MLERAALGALLGERVVSVARAPLTTEGFSDNTIERLRVEAENGASEDLILKVFDPEDWIARLSRDGRLREVALHEQGWYQQLPASCTSPILASSRDGGGGALLMTDVSAHIFEEGDSVISDEAADTAVRGLAALHAANWQRNAPTSLGLCRLDDWIGLLHPEVGRRRAELGVGNPVTEMLESGWETFHSVASAAASSLVRRIQENPTPLLDAMASGPTTLVHGDAKLANLGVTGTGDLIMIDWALAGILPPLLDIGWYLAVNSARLPWDKETTLTRYRDHLADYDIRLDQWESDLALGLLAGGVLRLGWVKALGSLSEDDAVAQRERREVEWWSNAAERAASVLA